MRSRGGFCSSAHCFLRSLSARNRQEPSFPSRIGSAVDAAAHLSRCHSNRSVEKGGPCHAELGRYVSDHCPDRGHSGLWRYRRSSIEIAKVIFFIAVVLFLVSAVVGLARGRTRV